MSYAFMKVLESSPRRYDRGMQLLTLGRLERVHHDIAARVSPGERVLDLGCGTGMLVAELSHKGVQVTGVDISPPMLGQAAQRLRHEGVQEEVTLAELGAVDLDRAFPDNSFDAVVSILVFSELSDDEIIYTLAQCWRILRTGGQLLIADEVLPDSFVGRVATLVLRVPFAILAFALTQNTTHRVGGLRERIEGAGFRVVEVVGYLAGTLRLYCADKG